VYKYIYIICIYRVSGWSPAILWEVIRYYYCCSIWIMIIIALTINYFPFLIICVIVNLCVINLYIHSVCTSASDRIRYKSKSPEPFFYLSFLSFLRFHICIYIWIILIDRWIPDCHRFRNKKNKNWYRYVNARNWPKQKESKKEEPKWLHERLQR